MRDLQADPPTQRYAGEGLEHKPESTVSSLKSRGPKPLSPATQRETRLSGATHAPGDLCKDTQWHRWDQSQLQTAPTASGCRMATLLCVPRMEYYVARKMAELHLWEPHGGLIHT